MPNVHSESFRIEPSQRDQSNFGPRTPQFSNEHTSFRAAPYPKKYWAWSRDCTIMVPGRLVYYTGPKLYLNRTKIVQGMSLYVPGTRNCHRR